MGIREGRIILVSLKILVILTIFFLGALSGFFYSQKEEIFKKDIYLAFIDEVYQVIKENYWEKISDEELTNLFQLGAERLTGKPEKIKLKDKANLEKILAKILKTLKSKEKKKEFTAKLADIVLANLKPFGRNRLYNKKEEKSLKERVQNISQIDQYKVLGLKKEAPQEEIKIAYQEKIRELEPKKGSSAKVKQEYDQVQQAYKILSDPESKKIYDLTGAEPTIDYRLIRPEIFYLHLKKISPTSFDELKRITEEFDNKEELDTLIFDLRDNIGGSIDVLPYFLGPFIGFDQYAYEFFHQGEKTAFKTKTGWLPSLVRYKKVVILINEGTQSSAEVMASVLKKYNVGVTVGTPTKGWGTVEKVFPLKNQIDPKERFSIFLAHSLALREDGQLIEGNGVEPVININNPNWERELFAYIHYPELAEAVRKLVQTD